MGAICQREGLWQILHVDFWQPLHYLLCYPLHCKSLKHWNISQIPRCPFLSIYILYFITDMFSHDIWEKRSHLLPLTVVAGRYLDFPDLSCLKLFLCSAIHSFLDWRGTIKSSEDSDVLVVATLLFSGAVNIKARDVTPDTQYSSFPMILQAPKPLVKTSCKKKKCDFLLSRLNTD